MNDLSQWRALVRSKLEPKGLLIPLGDGLHEWTRPFRDMLVDMSEFLRRSGATPAEATADYILTETGAVHLCDFTVAEIQLLMEKAAAFDLEDARQISVRAPRPPLPLRSAREDFREHGR